MDANTAEMRSQWARAEQRLWKDIPSFAVVWNPLVEASIESRPWSDDPTVLLYTRFRALKSTLGHTRYSLERLQQLNSIEASNTFEFYVAHYLYDFVSRIKTGTDLLALIINCVYGLGLTDRACSLENGRLVGRLRSEHHENERIEQLARAVDRARTSWLGTFDKLRDVVIHQAGLEFLLISSHEHKIHVSIPLPRYSEKPSFIQSDPKDPLAHLRRYVEEDLLIKLLVEMGSNSVTDFLITVDPVKLCAELWRLMAGTTESLVQQCSSDVLRIIAAPHSEQT